MSVPVIFYRIIVRMNDDEWSSHENGGIMERLAREQLRHYAHLNTEISVVAADVWEHAGWSLLYALDPDTNNPTDPLFVVGSANTEAHYHGKSARIRSKIRHARTEILPAINGRSHKEPHVQA